MIKNIFSLLFLIIFCFFNCARQAVKTAITKENLSENIVRWQDKVSQKSGTGEMTVSEPDKRFSSYFSFQYNVEEKSLSGELLGSFGMSIGTFYFSEDSISIRDKDGKQVKKEVLSLLEENPDVSLSRFLMWDIPISYYSKVIPLEDGWLLSDTDSEIFVATDFKPTQVVLHKNNKISIKYSDFRIQNGTSCPFKTEAKTEGKSLEIEFRKIQLE
jgi:outer membrane biogenesis lipoprotein LolB